MGYVQGRGCGLAGSIGWNQDYIHTYLWAAWAEPLRDGVSITCGWRGRLARSDPHMAFVCTYVCMYACMSMRTVVGAVRCASTHIVYIHRRHRSQWSCERDSRMARWCDALLQGWLGVRIRTHTTTATWTHAELPRNIISQFLKRSSETVAGSSTSFQDLE